MKVLSTPRRRLAIAGLVLAVVLVMATARRTAVDVLFEPVARAPDTTRAGEAGGPQSIIAFHIDPETNTTGVIDLTPPPLPPPVREDTATVRPDEPRADPRPDLDLDDLLEREAGPRGGASPAGVASVPPRPVEITWPETRQLKQCIGLSVSVRIHVSEEGKVGDVKLVSAGVLPACAGAALEAARHIRFEPGRHGGIPVAMWTDVRIDFQRRE